jgi:RNA polymerase sigma factor (sigma-70 family)
MAETRQRQRRLGRAPSRPGGPPPPPVVRVDDGPADVVAAAEAQLVAAWQTARAAGHTERAQSLAGFVLETNHSLVTREVRRYRLWRLDRSELMQAGRLGLLMAMRRFDATRGVPFSAYAPSWVRKEVQRALAAGEYALAIPDHRPAPGLAFVISNDLPGDVAVDLDRLPSQEAGVAEAVESEMVRDEIVARVNELPPAQRLAIQLHFGFDGEELSCRQIARQTGTSDFTVRTHVARARRTLRARLRHLA